MKKIILFLLVLLLAFTTCDIFSPVDLEELDRTNEYDPESEDFSGTVTVDTDGDGIADISDPDEINLVSPEDGSIIGDSTPTLSMTPKIMSG